MDTDLRELLSKIEATDLSEHLSKIEAVRQFSALVASESERAAQAERDAVQARIAAALERIADQLNAWTKYGPKHADSVESTVKGVNVHLVNR